MLIILLYLFFASEDIFIGKFINFINEWILLEISDKNLFFFYQLIILIHKFIYYILLYILIPNRYILKSYNIIFKLNIRF